MASSAWKTRAAAAAGRQPPETRERSSCYLLPGELFAACEPYAVTTILGSCVAVCLWDRRLRAGGVNHFLMPSGKDDASSPSRFGDRATDRLIEELLALGSAQRDLQAKLFGGAHVITVALHNGQHLGDKNVEVAREVLAAHRIPVVAEDVGGATGRKLIFFTDDGSVRVQRLHRKGKASG